MDGITLSVIRCEIGGYLPLKVQRVQQPGKKELALSLWSPSLRERLVLSLEGNNPFFGFSDEKKENPPAPPGFCLALRKRLEGGVLTTVRQEGLDRVLYLDFDGRDDLGDATRFVLVFDMAGRGQNIGLYRDGVLEAEIAPADGVRFEHGGSYTPPSSGRLDIRELTLAGEAAGLLPRRPAADLESLLLSREDAAVWVLSSTFEGVGKDLAVGILARAGQDALSRFTPGGARRAVEVLMEISAALRSGVWRPAIYISPSGPVFNVFPLAHLEMDEEFKTALLGAKAYRARVLEIQVFSSLKAYAEALHRKVLKKVQSRHDAQLQDLGRSQDYAKYRAWAELIDTSGKRNPPGSSEMTVTDYYRDPPEERVVPLDPRYSSRDNARIYYRTYAKLARAEKALQESVRKMEGELARLGDAGQALDGAAEVQELAKVVSGLEGLAKAEGISARPPRRRPSSSHAASGLEASAGPAIETTDGPDGSVFFAGTSARQNDYLVTKLRKPGDVWLHAKGVKGAHVLARPPAGQELPEDALLAAAALAAERSGASGSSKVQVDYVDAMRLRKPRGGAPGFVTYTGQKTIVVSLTSTPPLPGSKGPSSPP